MYRFGENTVKRRHRHIFLVCLALLICAIAGWWLHLQTRSSTTIGATPPPVIASVTDNKSPTKHFDVGAYSFDLPSDWEEVSQNSIYKQHGWQNTAGDRGVRSLLIYEDAMPPAQALNRLVAVQATGDHLVLKGEVSDNCINFTQASQVDSKTATVHAKWNGIDFICDSGNYLRDVVGTGSADGLNIVKATGSVTGTHSFLFLYTDNTNQPDYQIFYDVIASFVVK